MAFRPYGGFSFSSTMPGLSGPRRPSIEDLLDPLADPEYPEEPEPINRARGLSKDQRSQLTMELLANLAMAMSASGEGRLGSGLARAAAANLGAEQNAVGRANEERQVEYRRKYQQAEKEASAWQAGAKRKQESSQIESMLAVGDKAIEMVGGAEADPKFAAKVYSLMQERNASALQAMLDQAPARRKAREAGYDPDDPVGMEEWKTERDLAGKKREMEELDPLKSERELEDYEAKKKIDRRYPAPREPQRDRMWFDPTSGQVINLDQGTAGQPVGGYEPRPRSGNDFDDVEREAMDAANRAQTQYDRGAFKPVYQNANPKRPHFTRDPNQVGQDVPFNWESSYRANERTLRKLSGEKAAKADPSTGQRGAAPVVSPDRKGVQSPKGAPVGMGGGIVKTLTAKPDVERKVSSVESKVGPLTDAQKALLRKKLATMTVDQAVKEIQRRRGGG